MKETLEIVIYKSGLLLCHPTDSNITEYIAKEEGGIADKIAAFIKQISASRNNLHIFVAEDLVFFKVFYLPADTLDLKEAVGYQMEMLTPFADETTWHSFESSLDEEGYRINLFTARSQFIDVYLQEIIDAGYHISGLYPESQRYASKVNRKTEWGLILPGNFAKAYRFVGNEMKERLLCSTAPNFPEAVEACKTDMIFKYDEDTPPPEEDAQMPTEKPFFDFIDARFLLQHRPLLKSYNMLPATYQRPDYTKIIVAALLVINLVTLLCLGGAKVYRLKTINDQVSQEIANIKPLVNEMKRLRGKEEESLETIASLTELRQDFDFIDFFSTLTAELPRTSYVDQMRMDKKNHSVHVQGYTSDMSGLTSSLQSVGDAQLKSTSRRKNKTYFHVEITLP